MITRRDWLTHAAALSAALGTTRLPAADSATPAAKALADVPILRTIPSSREKLPVIGLGTNNYSPTTLEERLARRVVLERLPQLGGRVVDTAPAYRESEKVLGELIAELGNRERLFLATKVTAPGGNVDQGRAMIEQSFRRLQTARIDLLQVHNLDGLDVLMPELESLKRTGRIRYIGITTSRAAQYPAMLAAMRRHPFDFIQVDYSLGNRGAAEAILPLARQRRQAVLVNLPFGGRRDSNLFAQVREKALPPWAAQFGAGSWAQFFLKYVIGHPAITAVIPGMTKLGNLEDNARAGMGLLPDAAMRQRIEKFWDEEIAPAGTAPPATTG